MRRGATQRRGFTLIELGVVVLIIGLVLGMVLVVSFSATEAARIRATQGLIAKLEAGLNDRLEGLMATSVTPNGTHRWLAAINPSGFPAGNVQSPLPWGLTSEQRAQVIARIDQVRMELPDVFYVQAIAEYPINFAGLPFPLTSNAPYQNSVLPLGNRVGPGFTPSGAAPAPQQGGGFYPPEQLNPDMAVQAYNDGQANLGPGGYVGNAGTPQLEFGGVPDQGIYGASFAIRGAFHRLLGYGPIGVDGVDNNGNGLIDERTEGEVGGNTALLDTFLANHQHDTARAEMLYLLLVEGPGSAGGVFTKLDFKDSEVRDTDNDGIPEFIDAWGRPLLFYRWPVLHPEVGVSQGGAPYETATEVRDVFPLDPGKQLMAPGWWLQDANQLGVGKPLLIQRYFTLLTDLNYAVRGAGPPYPTVWDITGALPRRSYNAKFLIVSGGPDRDTGLYQVPAIAATPEAAINLVGYADPSNWPGSVVVGENWALYRNMFPLTDPALIQQFTGSNAIPYAPPDEALDNVTNQGVRNETGGVR